MQTCTKAVEQSRPPTWRDPRCHSPLQKGLGHKAFTLSGSPKNLNLQLRSLSLLVFHSKLQTRDTLHASHAQPHLKPWDLLTKHSGTFCWFANVLPSLKSCTWKLNVNMTQNSFVNKQRLRQPVGAFLLANGLLPNS